jgi:hypothetical protein
MSRLDDAGRRRWILEQLREVVMRLASPAEEQMAYLQRLGSGRSADELALELDDVAGPALSEEGLIAPEPRIRILELNQQLEAMSGAENAALWTETALQSSEAWAEIRRCAEAALHELDQQQKDQS